RVEAPVGGDLVQPGAQRGAPAEPGQALPGGQQRVLQRVLGVGKGSEHPVAVHKQLPAVGLGQLPERVAVPGPRPLAQPPCPPRPRAPLSSPRAVPPASPPPPPPPPPGPPSPPETAPAPDANWAAAPRPVGRRRGACID